MIQRGGIYLPYRGWGVFIWWHGNTSTPKRLNTETDQKCFWGISVFFRNSRKSLKNSELLRDFRIFCIHFPIFWVEWFPLFFDQFPHILKSVTSYFWSISSFFKTLKISVCLSVSSNLWSVSSYFCSVSAFF